MPGLVDHLRGVQQRFRRNAADIQADAAELRPAIDQDHAEAEIRRTKGRRVATGPGADDEHFRRQIRGRFTGRDAGVIRRLRDRSLPSRQNDRFAVAGHHDGRLSQRRQPHSITARGRHDGDQAALRYPVPLRDADFLDHAARGRRHVHRRLVCLERDQRRLRLDDVAGLDQDLDDLDVLEFAEIRDALLDDAAHGTASTRLSGCVSASASAVLGCSEATTSK